MKKVIATPLKESFSNPDLGEMSVVALEPSSQEVRAASAETFPPNQNIFITRGYSSIGFKFSAGELVRLINVEENRQYNDAPNKTKFIAKVSTDRAFETVGQHEYVHVFEAPLEELKPNGEIVVKVRPWRDFLIRMPNGDMYGPFYDASPSQVGASYSVRLRAIDTSPVEFIANQTPWGVARFRSADIPEDVFLSIRYRVSEFESIDELVVPNLARLREKAAEWLDWIDDDGLVDWANDWLGDEGGGLELSRALSALAVRLNSAEIGTEIEKQRLGRVNALVERLQLWTGQGPRLVSEFLSGTKTGRDRVTQFLDENKGEYLKGLEEEAAELRSEVDGLLEEKRVIDQEIDSAEVLPKSGLGLSDEEAKVLALPDLEREMLVQKIRDLTHTDSLQKQIGILEYQSKELEKKEVTLQKRVTELTDLKNSLLSDVKSTQEQHKSQLRNLKPYVDLLSGVVDSEGQGAVGSRAKPSTHNVTDIGDYLAEVRTRLAGVGRDFRIEEIANLLVTVSQNFMTVFAGLPGVGKTSLVCHLADALGLTSTEFLQIPVSRGWTSSRELVGYHNPLSQQFQASATGLFPFLCQANTPEDESGLRPAWVLLDEANLSPIEHYWSTFVAMADSESKRAIRTGSTDSESELALTPSLRFLATINHDYTTEPLSPRLLDRAPVVMLSPPSHKDVLRFAPSHKKIATPIRNCVDWADLNQKLAGEGEVKFTLDEQKIYSKIHEVLADSSESGVQVVVSPRKSRAIARYVSGARPLMRDSHPLCALDFALSQYLLPSLGGRGREFGERLSRVRDSTPETSLPRTRRMMNRIIGRGELEHHHYSFFSWM